MKRIGRVLTIFVAALLGGFAATKLNFVGLVIGCVVISLLAVVATLFVSVGKK